MVVPQFSNFGKKAKDLLSKQYDYKNEVKVTSKTSGVKFEVGGVHSAKGIGGSTKVNFSDSTFGDVEVTTGTCGMAKFQVKKNKIADGVNLTVTGDVNGLGLEGTYEQDAFSSMAKIDHSWSKGKTGLTACASIGSDGINVGGTVKLDCANLAAPTDYNVGAEYCQKDLIASLVTSDKGDNIKVSFFQKVSSILSLGTTMLVKPEDNVRLLTFGADYALDKTTQIKAKADSKGIVSTAVTHTLGSPAAKFIVSAEFNSLGSDKLAAQKLGVSINLGDF